MNLNIREYSNPSKRYCFEGVKIFISRYDLPLLLENASIIMNTILDNPNI